MCKLDVRRTLDLARRAYVPLVVIAGAVWAVEELYDEGVCGAEEGQEVCFLDGELPLCRVWG